MEVICFEAERVKRQDNGRGGGREKECYTKISFTSK